MMVRCTACSPAQAGVQSGRLRRIDAALNQLIAPNWAPAFAGERGVIA